MKTIAIAILALSLGACATTPDQRAIDQQKADQIFGEAKRYLAIVRGHPPVEGEIDHPLVRRLDPIERSRGRGAASGLSFGRHRSARRHCGRAA